MLATESARLGSNKAMWSPSVVRRLQLGVYSQLGDVELVSAGDPDRDVFFQFANQFTVFVPSAWVRTGADERLLRRAIESEKPAHTSYELRLVEPRLRLGVQSTVGLDTIIGGRPSIRLDCGASQDLPAARAPRNRLGYDAVLGGSIDLVSRAHGMTVGKDSLLA